MVYEASMRYSSVSSSVYISIATYKAPIYLKIIFCTYRLEDVSVWVFVYYPLNSEVTWQMYFQSTTIWNINICSIYDISRREITVINKGNCYINVTKILFILYKNMFFSVTILERKVLTIIIYLWNYFSIHFRLFSLLFLSILFSLFFFTVFIIYYRVQNDLTILKQ